MSYIRMKEPHATRLVDNMCFSSRKIPPYTRFEVCGEVLRIRHFDYLTLKMEALFTYETYVSIYQSRRPNVQEDLSIPVLLYYMS